MFLSEKMKWKALLSVIIILAIAGFFFFTGIGSQYTAQIIKYTGDLGLGSLTGFLTNQKPSTSFPFTLTAQNAAFFSQDYTVTNGSISASGLYQYINAGNLNLESTSGKEITVSLQNYNGDFQISADGSIILKGTATNVQIGDLSASSSKINLQIEILPSTYSLSSFQDNTMNFAGITGTLQRTTSDKTDTVNLSNNNVTVKYFSGSISQQQGTTTLQGTAYSIKGDNFSFV